MVGHQKLFARICGPRHPRHPPCERADLVAQLQLVAVLLPREAAARHQLLPRAHHVDEGQALPVGDGAVGEHVADRLTTILDGHQAGARLEHALRRVAELPREVELCGSEAFREDAPLVLDVLLRPPLALPRQLRDFVVALPLRLQLGAEGRDARLVLLHSQVVNLRDRGLLQPLELRVRSLERRHTRVEYFELPRDLRGWGGGGAGVGQGWGRGGAGVVVVAAVAAVVMLFRSW